MLLRVVFAGGAAALAVLAAAPAPERWLKLSSTHFEVFTTAGERTARDAVRHFERVRSVFAQAVPATRALSGRVRIIAFRSEKEFAPYRIHEHGRAFHVRAAGRDCIVMRGIAAEDYPTGIHEYAHVVLSHTGLGPRFWLSEGLAEVYSSLKVYGARVRVGDPIPARLATLSAGGWFSFAALSAMHRESPAYHSGDGARLFYAQSWALAHMLSFSPDYRPKAGMYLQLAAQGMGDHAAFQEAFGKSMDEVHADLRHYVRAGSFPTVAFTADLQVSPMEIRPAPPIETRLALAGVLAGTGKRERASAEYATHPESWEAQEGLARLARDGGCRHYERALELGCPRPETWFEYATRCRPPDSVEVLTKALALRPEFNEARLQLALELVNHGQYAAAVKHLTRIGTVVREHAAPYYRALALAQKRLGNPAEAEKAERLLQLISSAPR